MRKPAAVAVAFALVLSGSRAMAARDPLSDAKIALRFDRTKVLIIGGIPVDYRHAKLGYDDVSRFPELTIRATLSPAEMTFEITQQIVQALMPEHRVGFQIGAHWQIYPGAGRPTTVGIEKLVLLDHGNGNQYVGAIGRILNRDAANRIAGLSAVQYLAIPGAVLPGISQISMKRLDEPVDEITKLLFECGRQMVHDDRWQLEGTSDPDLTKRIREMNSAFLARGEFHTREIRMWRWSPGGGKPLLFVEAVWFDEDRKLPLFAVDAVVQEGDKPSILSFNCTKAEWMRGAEFQDRDWRFDMAEPAFLNAWKIGSEYFVLTYISGYEGYGVDLEKVDFVKGLLPVLGFGS